ncbi:unnamed protein product [Polarella glacialis]|uniref:Uncharacterized protein n=1 Tax=Polarella glacialis TaxID=89957 RepID=A0A813KJ64_POLGL|nr:unnamed protein product [Polarella glacialis]CAE8700434.1 unnamed protein product [Polarella glacialis]
MTPSNCRMSLSALLAAWAFVLHPACAAPMPQCDGDASPGCAIPKAQVLLQNSRQKTLQVHALSGSLAEQSALAQELVDEVVKHGRNLSNVQREIVERLNATFFNETLPQLQERHQNDQRLLDVHASSIRQCDADLATAQSSVAGVSGEQSALKASHSRCEAEKTNVTSEKEAKQASLTAFLSAAAAPSNVMPAQRGPTPEMDAFLASNLEFYASFKTSFAAEKAALTAAAASLSNKTVECSEGKVSFDAKFCEWKTEVQGATATYSTCRSEGATLYQATLSAARSNAGGRKADYGALMKVQCFLKVLLAWDSAMATSKLEECSNEAVTNPSSLDLTEPSLPAYNETSISSLGSPGSEVQCETSNNAATSASIYGTYG